MNNGFITFSKSHEKIEKSFEFEIFLHIQILSHTKKNHDVKIIH